MHARCEHGRHDLCADTVQRLGQDAYCVSRGSGVGVLKGDGEDHALAGKDGLAVRAIPSVKEPLDPKETSCLSCRPGLYSIELPLEWRTVWHPHHTSKLVHALLE